MTTGPTKPLRVVILGAGFGGLNTHPIAAPAEPSCYDEETARRLLGNISEYYLTLPSGQV